MNRIWILALAPLVLGVALWGCTEKEHEITLPPPDGGGTPDKELTCIGCHESEEMLKASLGKTSGSKVGVPDKGDG